MSLTTCKTGQTSFQAFEGWIIGLRQIPLRTIPADFSKFGKHLPEKAQIKSALSSRSTHQTIWFKWISNISQLHGSTMDLLTRLERRFFLKETLAPRIGIFPWLECTQSSLMGAWMSPRSLFGNTATKDRSVDSFLCRSLLCLLYKTDLRSLIQKIHSRGLSQINDFWHRLLAPLDDSSREFPGFWQFDIFPAKTHVGIGHPKICYPLTTVKSAFSWRFF